MSHGPEYGYPWWLTYGHLVLLVPAIALCALGIARRWPRLLVAAILLVVVWSAAAFLAARFVLNVNGPLALPTAAFLTSGEGRVLDIGAGTGRSTVMVLQARPRATVVALDLFAESFDAHFGRGQSGEERLRANLRATGVEPRAAIQRGDMRQLPFEPASFDGVVSTYAMDHLPRAGSQAAIREAARVLRPGGDFLLMVLSKDGWLQFTFGPLLLHSGTRSAEWWIGALTEAGLNVPEHGTRPGTLYFLARKAGGR